ncbi:MAG TPA: response regulator [Steroidobacteraceae bacterium]|jgi:DNA-binding response OmpR family regulator
MHGRTDAGGPVLAGSRILAVEDDYLLLLEIATVLREAGAVVIQCGTVEQALQAIDTRRPTAAILDVRIGRGTIAPVARKLAELETPFIFYTGQVSDEQSLSQWPYARTLSKPAPPTVLVSAFVELLQSAEPRRHG